MKKLFMVFISVFVLASVCSAQTPVEYSLKYVVRDGFAQIYGAEGDVPETLVFPSEIDGVPVKKVGNAGIPEEWNLDVTDIGKAKNLVFEDGIEEISRCAFRDNANIVSVKLPESLKILGSEAFSGCRSLKSINLENVEHLESHAFYKCVSLENVTLLSLKEYQGAPDGGTANFAGIASAPFYGCDGLKKVRVKYPNVYGNLFVNCPALKTILLEKSDALPGKYEFCGAYQYSKYDGTYSSAPEGLVIYCKDQSAMKYASERHIRYQTYVTVIVNGAEVDFGDCCAVIENGSTLVPARALFETLGAQVSWNGETKTVYAERDGRLISFKIGDSRIYVDGQVKELGLSVKIIDSAAYIPLRSMCDALDYKLSWDEETKSAEVSYASF